MTQFTHNSFSSVYFPFNKLPVLFCSWILSCKKTRLLLRVESTWRHPWKPLVTFAPSKGLLEGKFSSLVHLRLLHVLRIKINYLNDSTVILEKRALWHLIKHWFPLHSIKKLTVKTCEDETAGENGSYINENGGDLLIFLVYVPLINIQFFTSGINSGK